MKYLNTCKFCANEFPTDIKKTLFCKDKCRYDFHNSMQRFGDITTEVPLTGKLSGRGRRAKGARGEREVCRLIAGVTGEDIARNISQSRDGGHDIDWGPFAMEVKTTETVSMPAWQSQVLKSVEGTDKVPSIVWRRKGEEWWIGLPLQSFVEIFNMLRLAAEAGLKEHE